jgi:hypothetical protein
VPTTDQWFTELHVWDAQWPKLVHCPRCGERASVLRDNERVRRVRLQCPACGLVRDGDGTRMYVADDAGKPVEVPVGRDSRTPLDPATGKPWPGKHSPPQGYEPAFGTRLWLATTCCGGRLVWANNEAHLQRIRSYVAADIRHRRRPTHPLERDLPGWMKDAKHRDEILRSLDKLSATLDG